VSVATPLSVVRKLPRYVAWRAEIEIVSPEFAPVRSVIVFLLTRRPL